VAQTLYSHALRILTCAQCGAPVDASAGGGSVTCAYCHAVSHFTRRDESEDLSAAQAGRAAEISEQERYARLRQQDQQPPALPPQLAAWLVDGHLPTERVGEAERAWREARAEIAITPSFPVCERLYHLTVMLAPHLDERRRRATLETAIETLPDAGHRHVLRCSLAREAAKVGDLAAAEAWLAPVNPRPTDLEQDTAYRLAAATLACARHEPAKVAELLGFRRDDVPLENRSEVACWMLRIDALEKLGRAHDAHAEMDGLVRRWGRERIRAALAHHHPLELCRGSFAAAEATAAHAEQRARRAGDAAKLEQLDAQLKRLRPPLGSAIVNRLIVAGLLTFLVGSVWTCILSGPLEADPLFGLHARVVCPGVCADCEAPYHFVSWTTTTNNQSSSSTLNIYCSDAAGRVTDGYALSLAAVNEEPWLTRYEVRGGIWFVALTMYAVFYPLCLVFVVALRVRRTLRSRDQVARLKAERDALRAKLGHAAR